MEYVTREVFLASRSCAGMAWMLGNLEEPPELTPAEAFAKDQARETRVAARERYPGGVLIVPEGDLDVFRVTEDLIYGDGTQNLYDAAFDVDGLRATADVLHWDGDGWHLVEVKTATAEQPGYIDDLAYTVMVARRADVEVTRASLLLLSKNYRRGMPLDELFVEIDHTEEANRLAGEFTEHWRQVRHTLLGEGRPDPEFQYSCKNCELYETDCMGVGIDYPLFGIPRLGEPRFNALRDLGIECIADIPVHFELTPHQEIVRHAVATHHPWLASTLQHEMEKVVWPAYYLDFETTSSALPLYPGVEPYGQVPFQYSIHICPYLGKLGEHRTFLADHTVDERWDLAVSLLDHLNERGSIVVYTGFEKRILTGLKVQFPGLAERIDAAISRLFDLEDLIRKNFYHPDFRGSFSIKRVLPALCPDLSYENLGITNGADASALFARMVRGERTDQQCDMIRADLEEYCARDTMAMVELHKALMAMVPG